MARYCVQSFSWKYFTELNDVLHILRKMDDYELRACYVGQ